MPTAPGQIDLAVGTYLGSVVSGFGSGDTVDFQSVAFDGGRHRDLHRKRRQERRHGGGRRCERRGSGAIRPSWLLQRREFLDVGGYERRLAHRMAGGRGRRCRGSHGAHGFQPGVAGPGERPSRGRGRPRHIAANRLYRRRYRPSRRRSAEGRNDRRRSRPAPARSDLCLTATSATGRRSAAALPAGATAEARGGSPRRVRPPFGQAACCLAFSQPRFTRTSAIWIALSAAPLRRLSETHHSKRPLSTVGSSRMREI